MNRIHFHGMLEDDLAIDFIKFLMDHRRWDKVDVKKENNIRYRDKVLFRREKTESYGLYVIEAEEY